MNAKQTNEATPSELSREHAELRSQVAHLQSAMRDQWLMTQWALERSRIDRARVGALLKLARATR